MKKNKQFKAPKDILLNCFPYIFLMQVAELTLIYLSKEVVHKRPQDSAGRHALVHPISTTASCDGGLPSGSHLFPSTGHLLELHQSNVSHVLTFLLLLLLFSSLFLAASYHHHSPSCSQDTNPWFLESCLSLHKGYPLKSLVACNDARIRTRDFRAKFFSLPVSLSLYCINYTVRSKLINQNNCPSLITFGSGKFCFRISVIIIYPNHFNCQVGVSVKARGIYPSLVLYGYQRILPEGF